MKRISLNHNVEPFQGIQPHMPIKPLCIPMKLSDGFSEALSGRFNNRVYSLWERLGLFFLEEDERQPQAAESHVIVNNFTQHIIFQLFSQKNIGRLIDLDQPGFVLIGKALSAAKSSNKLMKRRILGQLERRRIRKTAYSSELEGAFKLLSGEDVSVSDETLWRVLGVVVENIKGEELTDERGAVVIQNLCLQLEKRESFTGIARELSKFSETFDAEKLKKVNKDILTRVRGVFSEKRIASGRTVLGQAIERADIRAAELALAGARELTEKKAEELFNEDFPISERFERRLSLTDVYGEQAVDERSGSGAISHKTAFGTVLSRDEQLYTEAVYFLENAREQAAKRYFGLSEILRQSDMLGMIRSNTVHDIDLSERSMTASLMSRISHYAADKPTREDDQEKRRILEQLERRHIRKTAYSNELESAFKLLSGEDVSVSDETLWRVLGMVVENVKSEELTDGRGAAVIQNLCLQLEKREGFTGIARELSKFSGTFDTEKLKSVNEDILTRVRGVFSGKRIASGRTVLGQAIERADIRAAELALAGARELTEKKTEELFNEDFPISERFERRLSLTDVYGEQAVDERSGSGAISHKTAFGTVLSRDEQLYTEAVYFLENAREQAEKRFFGLSEIIRQSRRNGMIGSNTVHDTDLSERSMTASLMSRISRYVADKLTRDDRLDMHRFLARAELFTDILAVGTLDRARHDTVYFENPERGLYSDDLGSPRGVVRYSPIPMAAGDLSVRYASDSVLLDNFSNTADNSVSSVDLISDEVFLKTGSVTPASGELIHTETAADAVRTGSAVSVNADARMGYPTSGELIHTETAADAVRTGSAVPVSADARMGYPTSGELIHTETAADAVRTGSAVSVNADARMGYPTSGELIRTETAADAVRIVSAVPVSADARMSYPTSGELIHTETAADAVRTGSAVPVSDDARMGYPTSGELIRTETAADAVRTGSAVSVNADARMGYPTNGELIHTETAADAVRTGSAVSVNADARMGYPTSEELIQTETAADAVQTGSTVSVNADARMGYPTSEELIHTETAADTVRTGSAVPISVEARMGWPTSGELIHTETAAGADVQINQAAGAVGRVLSFRRAVGSTNSGGRSEDHGIVLSEIGAGNVFAENIPTMGSSASADNEEFFRKPLKNTRSYRDKLDSKTLEELDRIISRARRESTVSSEGTVIRYCETEHKILEDHVNADISFYAEPDLPRSTFVIGGTLPQAAGSAEMLILYRGLKNIGKFTSALAPEKSKSPHLARIISELEDKKSAEKQWIIVKSGFSFRTVDNGGEMVMLVHPPQMDKNLSESRYIRQLPPMDHKQREEQPQQQQQMAVPSKPKVINTAKSTVETVRNASTGRFENMTRAEINKLTDMVYNQLQTRIMRERRRFGM